MCVMDENAKITNINEEIRKGVPSSEDFLNQFKTKEDVENYFLKIMFPDGKVVCPKCGCSNQDIIYTSVKKSRGRTCYHCGYHFSLFIGTIFEFNTSKLPQWFYLIYSLFVNRKSVSNFQLVRTTGLCLRTVTKYRRLVDLAIMNYDLEPFSGVIQIDEEFLFGANHGRYNKNGNNKGKKKPVIGIFNEGRVYSALAIPNEKGQYLSGERLESFIDKTCLPGSVIVSDDFKGYNFLNKQEKDFWHETVNHNEYKFTNENGFTTNAIEGYWSLSKKQYYSVHQSFSPKWAHFFIEEQNFRYNYRYFNDFFDNLLKQAILFPRVIDIRQMGKFGNKTYKLSDYKMILPKQFDDINLKDITANDILNCEEPVYGVLRKDYQNRMKARCDGEEYPKEWQELGMKENFRQYKDYRDVIVNTIDDVKEMIKDATKHKEVNYKNNILRKTPRVYSRKSMDKSNKRRRILSMQRRYKKMPPIVQQQIKYEYPNMFKISDKEKQYEIQQRMGILLYWYNRRIMFTSPQTLNGHKVGKDEDWRKYSKVYNEQIA